MTKQNRTRLEALQQAALKVKLAGRYPDVPELPKHLLTVKHLKDTSANGLTRCIVTFLKGNGHVADPVQTTGTFRKGKSAIDFWTGKTIQIEKGFYTPNSQTKGRADISCMFVVSWSQYAVPVEIEVKFGKDRMSEHQKQYEQTILKAKAFYTVARTFDEFITWYDSFMEGRGV